jgi:hypothetical protein
MTPTPGPWTVDRINHPAGVDVSFEVVCGRRLIVQVEDEGEALLIALAPEMFDLLTTFASAFDYDLEFIGDIQPETVAATKVLIAKLGAKDA